MSVVMLFPFHQVGVSPLHESIQVGSGRGGHCDQVLAGPDLQPHQSNEGPQGLVCLQQITDFLFCTRWVKVDIRSLSGHTRPIFTTRHTCVIVIKKDLIWLRLQLTCWQWLCVIGTRKQQELTMLTKLTISNILCLRAVWSCFIFMYWNMSSG